ncbi:hypothetical protein FB567DRAFT_545729 [Paraphoma chrysanthemicola]|uniref:Uncharacterized protein n=1 Tax=Paraphoma chrysanthemicola TaxID=798071 RepID=A0A8K0W315_9PLEO|nr:hypothetical protein FB567DRAFT_545729 [Paraphoma chrysanthemicola]
MSGAYETDSRPLRTEILDQMREHEVMNSETTFPTSRAVALLDTVCYFAADMIADQVGGDLQDINFGGTTGRTFANNLFLQKFAAELTETSNMTTTPLQLEEDLMQLLEATSIEHYNNKFTIEVRENWTVVIRLFVEFLAWRQFERTEKVQGNVAGQFRYLIQF